MTCWLKRSGKGLGVHVSFLCGILVAAPGCRPSSSAVSPAADELSLRVGPSVLVLSGNDIAGDYPACSNVGLPPAGKQLSTTAVLSRSGDDWTISPSNQVAGDFQIRFRAMSSESGRTSVSGTAKGSVNHVNLPVLPFALDVYALLESAGQPTGAVEASVSITNPTRLNGLIVGQITFKDSVGRAGVCQQVAIDLQPMPAGWTF